MKSLLLAAAAALPIFAVTPAHAQRAGDRIANRYICVFDKSVSRSDATNAARRASERAGGAVDQVYSTAIRGFSVNIPDGIAGRLKANNPEIAFCEQDSIVRIPPVREVLQSRVRADRRRPGGGGGGTPQPTEETPWGVARVNGGQPGSFATAWVIDTGINLTHPDLNVDAARSRSFLGRRTTPNDQNGHGTHVAGTIAAKAGNGIGVVGVAPGAPVVAVRVLDAGGSGSNSGVIAGVDYVAANGRAGDVANMSLGGSISTALDQAVINAAATSGVRFALAAGNESDDAENHSPARAEGQNIFTISAFGIGDVFASFSNYGPHVDFSEPGVAVKSTWLNGGYNTISGTSMATPHFAGLLLAGQIKPGGNVIGDKDNKPDVIGVH